MRTLNNLPIAETHAPSVEYTTENGNIYIITSDIYRTAFTLWCQTNGKYNKIAKDTSPVPLYEIADKHAKGEYDGQS